MNSQISHMIFYTEYDSLIIYQKKGGNGMQKAIFSRVDLTSDNDLLAKEFVSCIQDLIEVDDVQELKAFSQHMDTSRFQHSLNVSYYSFLFARKFRLDTYSIARAGLLHDLYFYDWRTKNNRPMEGRHCAIHPLIALENAKKTCTINPVIEDAIVHHMWPMTLHMPKTKEGWLLQAVDKYCALSEIILQGSRKVRYSRAAVSFLTICSFATQIWK